MTTLETFTKLPVAKGFIFSLTKKRHSTSSLLQSLKISVAINETSLSQIALVSCNHTKIINDNNTKDGTVN